MDAITAVLIVIGLFTLVVIVAFFRFRQQGKAEIGGPFGTSLKVEGKNEAKAGGRGITARDVTSHEGGIQAVETTGSGIEVERIDAKGDVILESRNITNISSQHAQFGQFSMDLSAQALSAGGNITVQQFVGSQATMAEQLAFFVQQIGLINPRQDYAKSQFEAYCNVWKSLQSLRLAADDLWELASSERLLRFAEQLRQTTIVVREGEVFFEDSDRRNVLEVLHEFASFRVGKVRLIEMRSRRDIEEWGGETVAMDAIRRQIDENHQYKTAYEHLLDDIRDSFRSRLSNR